VIGVGSHVVLFLFHSVELRVGTVVTGRVVVIGRGRVVFIMNWEVFLLFLLFFLIGMSVV